MARRIARDFFLAASVFLVIAALFYFDYGFTEAVKDYVSFVVSTDFSFQPFLERTSFLRKIADWDLGTLLEDWHLLSPGW